jgi:hypothetical protein
MTAHTITFTPLSNSFNSSNLIHELRQNFMKITITVDEHLFNAIEEKRGNKSKSELCNEILKSYLEPDLFDIYEGHFQEVKDIANEEIDLTEYVDHRTKLIAENVFLKEKMKRINKIRDESNRQFLNYLEQIDKNETPTPEYIARCKKFMENPKSAKTISDAYNSGFLFYQYLCDNLLNTYEKYNDATAEISFEDASPSSWDEDQCQIPEQQSKNPTFLIMRDDNTSPFNCEP